MLTLPVICPQRDHDRWEDAHCAATGTPVRIGHCMQCLLEGRGAFSCVVQQLRARHAQDQPVTYYPTCIERRMAGTPKTPTESHGCEVHSTCTIDDCYRCPAYYSINIQCGDLAQMIPSPAYNTPQRFAVGVTTTGTRSGLLQVTNSIKYNGFNDVIVFADGQDGHYLDKLGDLPVVRRSSPIGIFANWYLGLLELRRAFPAADCYMMFQDDTVMVHGCGDYLRQALWPSDEPHAVSLFVAHRIARSVRRGWNACDYFTGGTCAMCFSKELLDEMLSQPDQLVSAWLNSTSSVDDRGVFDWLKQRNCHTYFAWPSLAEHLVQPSSHGGNTARHQCTASELAAPPVRPCSIVINERYIERHDHDMTAHITLAPGRSLRMTPREYLGYYYRDTPATIIYQLYNNDGQIGHDTTGCVVSFRSKSTRDRGPTLYDLSRIIWE
jgi:hypothetical protein